VTQLAAALWNRAIEALEAAKHVLQVSPNAAASRAYYAAFYAVSAALALQRKSYRKHCAVEAAVHRDFVKAGLWPKEIGQAYSGLLELRTLGDYGEVGNVKPENAKLAIEAAELIVKAVAQTHPAEFRFSNGASP
jgi:uncharacterized protein (UPF0332 family)